MAKPACRHGARRSDANASREAYRTQLAKSLFLPDLMTMRSVLSPLLIFITSTGSVLAGDSDLKSEEVYQAWLQMYDLKFEEAHHALERWQRTHPDDSLGPASDAAGYLF